MNSLRTGLAWCVLLAAGCGGSGSSGTNNVNPYANTGARQNSAAPAGSLRPRPAGSAPDAGHSAADDAPPIVLPQAGFAAEMGIPLSFAEYLRFARRSSEMLREMADIHAEVSDSGDAEPHQDRWGELTATHTKLVRDVVDSAYPPAELARDLRQSALPALAAAVEHASSVMTEFDDIEGGLAQPHAEARLIFEHLSKHLTPDELAGFSLEAASPPPETVEIAEP